MHWVKVAIRVQLKDILLNQYSPCFLVNYIALTPPLSPSPRR